MGALGFAVIRDKQGLMQVTLKRGTAPPELFDLFGGLPRESVVMVEGKVLENPKAKVGAEVMATAAKVLSRAETPLPLGVVDKVGVELDTRLSHRIIDLRKRDVQDVMEMRGVLLEGLRKTFMGLGFTEVETPKILKQGAEGGSTMFALDYFGEKAFLAQSPQLYKQMLMATDLERVFEIAPAFRAEPSDTVRHMTEFTSVDAEMAYIDGPEDLWEIVEKLIKGTLDHAATELKRTGNQLAKNIPPVKLPFPRIPFGKAMEMLGNPADEDMSSENEKALGEIMSKEGGNDFYFITEFPSALKRSTFYAMRQDANPEKTHYFDLDYKGLELISGGQREHRIDKVVSQIRNAGLDPANFGSYLEAFRYGMPPHGGFAMGLDRLAFRLTGLTNIREVRLFPRDRFRLEP
jgi:aspartyl-tRNA synthetase